MFYFLIIVNKNGSLIFDRMLTDKSKLNLGNNETIKFASIFYSMYAISDKITPTSLVKNKNYNIDSVGIEVVEGESVKLFCHQTLTKLKFIFFTDVSTTYPESENMFRKIYEIYSDYVSKNPFYEIDMPIRIEAFEKEITKLFS